MTFRLVTLCLVMWVPLAAAAEPANKQLTDARQLVDELDFAAALKLLDQVEKSQGLDAATLQETWLLQGIAYGNSNKEAKARDAFRKLMLVFPETKLPADVPPRARTPYLEAKSWADGVGTLALKLEAGEGVLHATVTSKDPLRLARFARFSVRVDGGAAQVTELPLINGTAELPASGKSFAWSVDVLTERHSTLLSASREDGVRAPAAVTPVAAATTSAPVVRDDATELRQSDVTPAGAWRRPVGVGFLVAGVAAAGLGAAFGLMSSSATNALKSAQRDELGRVVGLTQRDFATREAEANGQATVANVLYAAGAALGVAGVVLIIVGPSGAPVAQVTPTGGGLLLSGSF